MANISKRRHPWKTKLAHGARGPHCLKAAYSPQTALMLYIHYLSPHHLLLCLQPGLTPSWYDRLVYLLLFASPQMANGPSEKAKEHPQHPLHLFCFIFSPTWLTFKHLTHPTTLFSVSSHWNIVTLRAGVCLSGSLMSPAPSMTPAPSRGSVGEC